MKRERPATGMPMSTTDEFASLTHLQCQTQAALPSRDDRSQRTVRRRVVGSRSPLRPSPRTPRPRTGRESRRPIRSPANMLVGQARFRTEPPLPADGLVAGLVGLLRPSGRKPRGRNLRQRATRLERKLQRESSAALTIARPSEDRRLFERCLQLEARGWKGKAGTAILSSVRTARFYRQVAEQPAARLFALDSSHGLLAFSLCLLHRQRLFLLKTAYNEEHRTASPGLVLHYATIGVCHELNLEAYELLGGADPWKLRLANGSRSISRLVAHRPTPLGSAGHRVRAARTLAKRWRTQLPRKGSQR